MLTLYDILKKTRYDQIFHVYLSNDWDDNTVVGRGTRADLLAQEKECSKDENMTFDYLNNEVEMVYCEGKVIIVMLIDDDHNRPVQDIWFDGIKTYESKKPVLERKFVSSCDIVKIAQEV